MLLAFLLVPLLLAHMVGAVRLPDGAMPILFGVMIVAISGVMFYFSPHFAYVNGMPNPQVVTEVRRSGRPLVSVRTAGGVGAVWFKWPGLGVVVHPGGVVFSPAGMPPFALKHTEITKVVRSWAFRRLIEFHHTSAEVESPVMLGVWFGAEDVARAVESKLLPSDVASTT